MKKIIYDKKGETNFLKKTSLNKEVNFPRKVKSKSATAFLLNKKAELTSKQLIGIIILIISFSIILMFLFFLNLGKGIDEDACRNSVFMRANLEIFKDSVTLECKTQNVCITSGEDCSYGNDNKVLVSNKEELEKEMVNLIAKCWWMFGEGFDGDNKKGYSDDDDYCSICNDVYFNVPEDKFKITYKELYDWALAHEIGDETYLYNLYNLNSVEAVGKKIGGDDGTEGWHKISLDEPFDFNKNYAVVTSVIGDSNRAPIFVEFSSSELKSKTQCETYLTEAS